MVMAVKSKKKIEIKYIIHPVTSISKFEKNQLQKLKRTEAKVSAQELSYCVFLPLNCS